MPLILAIEPDRRQSSKLTMLARNQLHADLIVTDSVEQALSSLDELIPDLLLTSAQISSREGLALAERLRALDAEGLHVQTVVIPPLAVPGQRPKPLPKGAQPPVRGRALSQVAGGGCDPVVFGMQILAHLERAAARRPPAATGARPVPVSRPAASAPSTPAAAPTAGAALSTGGASASAPAPPDSPEEAAAEPTTGAGAQRIDWNDVLSAMRRDIEGALAPAAEPLDVRLADIQFASDPVVETLPAGAGVAPAVEASAAPVAGPAEVSATTPEPPRRKRRKPRQDEWGFFDPDRCGLSALISKVNEIAGSPSKKQA